MSAGEVEEQEMSDETVVGREEIDRQVMDVLKNMTSDLDFEFANGIGSDTRIASDLDFDSVQIVQLFSALNKQFDGARFPYQDLVFKDNQFVDFTIGDLVKFISGQLADA
jgi:acyl carrier protein